MAREEGWFCGRQKRAAGEKPPQGTCRYGWGWAVEASGVSGNGRVFGFSRGLVRLEVPGTMRERAPVSCEKEK